MQSGFYVIRELWQPGFCKTAPHYVSLLLSLSYCLALLLNLLKGFDYNYSNRCRTNTFVPFYISEVQNLRILNFSIVPKPDDTRKLQTQKQKECRLSVDTPKP